MKKPIKVRGGLGSLVIWAPRDRRGRYWLIVQDSPTVWTTAVLRRLARRLLAATDSFDSQKGKR